MVGVGGGSAKRTWDVVSVGEGGGAKTNMGCGRSGRRAV